MSTSALQHWQEVFGYAYSLTCDRAHAEDLCQEAYLRLFGMKRLRDGAGSLLPLLLTIVRNLVCTEARSPAAISLDDVEGAVELVDASTPTPSETALLNESREEVRAALAQLSSSWRAVLYLRDGLGLSYREISAVEGGSEDTVRVTLHRARQRLRVILSRTENVERKTQ